MLFFLIFSLSLARPPSVFAPIFDAWELIWFFLPEIGDGCLDRNGSFGSPVERFEFGKESVSRRLFFRSCDHLNLISSFTIVCFEFVLEVIFLAPVLCAKETMRLFPPSSCYWVHLPSNVCNIASNLRKLLFKWTTPHCCSCLA